METKEISVEKLLSIIEQKDRRMLLSSKIGPDEGADILVYKLQLIRLCMEHIL